MKKITALLLTVALCISMTACFKSEEAKQADAMILEMGEVTLDNEKMILDVEKAVNDLPEGQRKKLENIETLNKKRDEYDTLAADNTEEIISLIGAVKLDDSCEKKIVAARESYDALTDAAKKKVENYSVLESAEQDLTKKKVEYVEGEIAKIGAVSLSSEGAIAKAEEAYNKYGDDIKKLVGNATDIDNAKTALLDLKVAAVEDAAAAIGTVTLDSAAVIAKARETYDKYIADIEKAGKSVTCLEVITNAEAALVDAEKAAVEEAINAIGTVTKESGELIQNARTLFDKYNPDIEKAGKTVANADVLTAAEAAYESVVLEAGKAALSRLDVSTDEVRGITWYESPRQPYYADVRSYVLPYIGKDKTGVWMNVRHHYTDDDWVFFKKITYSIDGENYYNTFNYFDVDRDNEYGDVWEWVDKGATSRDIEILRKIAASTKTIVRFEGDSNWHDITISSADKAAITDVLDAYEYLKKAE